MPVGDDDFRQLERRVYDYRVETRAVLLAYKEILRRLDAMEPDVSALVDKDKIAEAVTAKMQSERRLVLSTAQKLGGLIAFGILVADFVHAYV